MKTIQFLIAAFAVVLFAGISSCLRKDFESPPDASGYDPGIPVNMKIRDLKARFKSATTAAIDSDWTVYGIVTADDRSGNFYKQINVEDSTGGIAVLLGSSNLYNEYPIGRKVYLKLKGLHYGYFSGLPQIGGDPDNVGNMTSLTPVSIAAHVVKANYPNVVSPVGVEVQDMATTNPFLLNRLVRLEHVQFAAADLNRTYAESPTVSSATTIQVEDCNGRKIALRTSGFAAFQRDSVPRGSGTIVALYTVYNNTPQLVIRDPGDVQFNGERCDINTPSAAVMISIDSLRRLYTGNEKLLKSIRIKGIVISDAANKNIGTGNIVVQDGTRGITIYFGGTVAPFALGDSVLVALDGATITKFQGVLEIKNITATSITKVASGKEVVPEELTIAQLLADFTNRDATLVRIKNAAISGGGIFSGNKMLNDGTATIILYTVSTATFASTLVPAATQSFTAIVTPYLPVNGSIVKEIKLRNIDDVQ